MFTCCQEPSQLHSPLEGLKPCERHKLPLQFVCLDPSCREAALLCIDCLVAHRQHRWETLLKFFTPEVKLMLATGDSITTQHIEKAAAAITALFLNFRQTITARITECEDKVSGRLRRLQERNQVRLQAGQPISQTSMAGLLYAKEKEESIEWIENMNTFLKSAIQESELTIANILTDLEAAVGTDWQERTAVENQQALVELREHLHPHKEVESAYFKFSASNKHPGIALSEDKLEATYRKNVPSCPVAIVQNPIALAHLRFAFQIIKLEKTAFLFAATTVFLGICNPLTVRSVGMRRINEAGKGAYMIGSSGWSYHHKDKKYDRKDVVGWGFAQGETIEVEVMVEEPGEIRFSKEGKIFKNNFSMPLGLSKKQILSLKPCVSFDADEGAIVRILNR